MIVRRPVMRFKLASILAKMMNIPAPVEDTHKEAVQDEDASQGHEA